MVLQTESETRFYGTGGAVYILVKDEQVQVKKMIADYGAYQLIANKIK